MAAQAAATPDPAYLQKMKPFLEDHCFDCHDDSTQKGGLRLDTLVPDFSTPEGARKWTSIFDHVRAGEMPPAKKQRPPQAEQRALLEWIGRGLLNAEATSRKAEGSAVARRLNRVEYENTVRDLLGITTPLQEFLPADAAPTEFDNIGEGMNTSAILMERYLEAADAALDAATASRKQPETKSGTYTFEPNSIPSYVARWTKKRGDAMVFFTTDMSRHRFRLAGFSASADGLYRVKVHASGSQTGGQPVHYAVECSEVLNGGRATLGYYEAPSDQPAIAEITVAMKARAQLWVKADAFSLHRLPQGANEDGRPGVAIHKIEVEGPINPTWPPTAHQALFGNHPLVPLGKAYPPSNELLGKYGASIIFTPVPAEPQKELERVLHTFLPRAFRRPVPIEEEQIYVKIAQAKLTEGKTFEEAVRVGMKAILCSPSFLFLREETGRLDDYAVASRLSYFLWSSMPDEELLSLAAQKKLTQPATLRAQTERMLKHAKARQFTENFTGQWLHLRDIDATTPDRDLYPEFDEWTQTSMVEETHRFFEELLTADLSVTNVVDSKFAMLNERMAALYGIEGVKGLAIRKVPLPDGSPRGGVLTQASVLKVTANGTTSSPIVRGAWVMKNIIGRPIPPPPENVPAIEPDIRGATSIRDQLDKHRNNESCASCHSKMDPPGMALESFDVIGGWRDKYRAIVPKGKAKVSVNGNNVKYGYGAAIDPSGALSDGKKFADIREFKKLLVTDHSTVARMMTNKLLSYAVGRPLGFTDRNTVESILSATKAGDYGLRSIVHQIVASDAFLQK